MRFRVGDRLRCIGRESEDVEENGAGWELGREFVVGSASEGPGSRSIYWPAPTGNGIYESALELASNPKKKPKGWFLSYSEFIRDRKGAERETIETDIAYLKGDGKFRIAGECNCANHKKQRKGEVDRLEKELSALGEASPKKSTITSQICLLKKHKKIEKVSAKEKHLEILTTELKIKEDSIGKYRIQVGLGGSRPFRVYNLAKEAESGSPHWYVNSENGICLGQMYKEVMDYFYKGSLYFVVDGILRVLQTSMGGGYRDPVRWIEKFNGRGPEHRPPRFRVGDRVRVLRDYEGRARGLAGTICFIQPSSEGIPDQLYGVNLDKKNAGDHTCNSTCPVGQGWNIRESYLERIEVPDGEARAEGESLTAEEIREAMAVMGSAARRVGVVETTAGDDILRITPTPAIRPDLFVEDEMEDLSL